MIPRVWSELPEPNSPDRKGKDCLYSAYLMGLLYGGVAAFPLGAYTTAEREAFERSDTRKDETGAFPSDGDVAAVRRYGVRLHDLPRSGLAAALATPGVGVLVTGMASAFPKGVRIGSFVGAHSVFAVALGGGKARMLDPLRPNRNSGQIVRTSVLLAFNRAGGSAFTCRLVRENELAPAQPKPPTPPTPPTPPRTYTVQQRDTLSGIAARHGTTWPVLYELNAALLKPNGPNYLRPGWVLKLP